MPASVALYHAVLARLQAATAGRVRKTSVVRLALLVSGVLLAQSCVLARVAEALAGLPLSSARWPESLERRLRRTLRDPGLEPATCLAPLLAAALDWPALRRGGRRLVLAADDSSHTDRVHLFRVSLCYRGGSLPLAWATWPQQVPLAAGEYWRRVEAVLDAAAALLPPGVPVLVCADRAFDVPAFARRVAARGWHWAVRAKAGGQLRFRDYRGREWRLGDLVAAHLRARGQRYKARGAAFKKAGWLAASVVAHWAPGQRERLVVLTDLPPDWEVLRAYDRRFWIEPGFRATKSSGWRWEQCQVRAPQAHRRLLLALAIADLLALALGRDEATQQRSARAARPAGGRPRPARLSLFTLGLRRLLRDLRANLPPRLSWWLGNPDGPSWNAEWLGAQAHYLIFQSVRS